MGLLGTEPDTQTEEDRRPPECQGGGLEVGVGHRKHDVKSLLSSVMIAGGEW